MKLTVARIFEVAQIAKTKSYEELSPFIEYVNSLADNTIRTLLNGVGLADNFDGQLLTIDLKNATPSSIATRKKPIAVFLARQSPRNPLITGFAWDLDNDGALRVEVAFTPTSDVSTLSVTVFAVFS